MRLAAFQPHLLPLLYYWNRMASVDKFILLDDAQFTRKSKGGEALQHFTYIRSTLGSKQKTSIAVHHLGHRASIKDAKVSSCLDLFTDIKAAYEHEEHFEEMYAWILSNTAFESLGHATCALITLFAREANLPTKLVVNSESPVTGKASEWMLNLCKHYNADTYVCGKTAYDQYLDKDAFVKAGIKIEVQNWTPRSYPQGEGEFIPNLSIVDVWARHGREGFLDAIR